MDEDKVLTVAGRYDQISIITKFVKAVGKAAGLEEDAVFHLELCCDEASTNIIEHAYGAEDVGTITIRCQTTPRAFTVTFLDHGRPFDPKDAAEPASFNTEANSSDPAIGEFLDNLKVGGLGMHFMRKLMDEVHYSFDSDQGNQLTLVKYISGEEQVTVAQLQLTPDLWLVEVQGRIDQTLMEQLEQTLNQLLADQHHNIIVDLGLATYINSGGLRCFLTSYRISRNQGGDLVLCGLNSRLSEIFQMIGFDQIFTIYDTRKEARNHFGA